jgi:hypothetical protein
MNPTQLLGALTLTAGCTLLVSEPVLGPDRLLELTGTTLVSLRPACVIAIGLGILAIGVGRREEKDAHQDIHRGDGSVRK